MAGWHHWLDGRESGWTPGVGDGQGGLACCNSWGRKELDMTEWLNWTELNQVDEPRAYYTEWSESESEKQMSYTNTCIWNPERWYWWTYLQGSNGDTKIENRLLGMAGGVEGEGKWMKSNIETYITICEITANGNLLYDSGNSNQGSVTT